MTQMTAPEKTLVVWRRLGKEHGERSGFRKNSSDIVDRHLRAKLGAFRKVPDEEWRWWQLNDDVIVEKPCPSGKCAWRIFRDAVA